MKATGGALALAMVFVTAFASAGAGAAPATGASGQAGVFLTIAPRVRIRAETDSLCAEPLNGAAGTLTVLTEHGSSLPTCDTTTPPSFERTESTREARTLLVTPI